LKIINLKNRVQQSPNPTIKLSDSVLDLA